MPATQSPLSSSLVDCTACGTLHRRDTKCPWGPGRNTAIVHPAIAALTSDHTLAAEHTGTRAQSIGTSLQGRRNHTPSAPRRSYTGTGRQATGRKSMSSRYDGTCAACGQRFPAGTQIFYAAGKATHAPECPEAAPVMQAAPVERLATPKQITLIETLQAERAQPIGAPENLTMAEASELIPALIALPRLSAGKGRIDLCGCPEGRYAVSTEDGHLAFYNVTERGVFVQASDSLHRVPGAAGQAIITKILVDPAEASRTYGRELGKCGVCNRTLTDEHSREHGIGPICSQNTGW
jgi:hypothetical protein